MESATWCRTPAAVSAARRLRPEVSKNSSTALSSNEGELARSITTCVPAMASLSPSPVMVLTPVLGEAATTSWPPWRRMATVFEPMRPVPPMTTIFTVPLACRWKQGIVSNPQRARLGQTREESWMRRGLGSPRTAVSETQGEDVWPLWATVSSRPATSSSSTLHQYGCRFVSMSHAVARSVVPEPLSHRFEDGFEHRRCQLPRIRVVARAVIAVGEEEWAELVHGAVLEREGGPARAERT